MSILPLFLIRNIFYSNGVSSINSSHSKYITKYGSTFERELLTIYIAVAHFKNNNTTLFEEYKKVVPLSCYFGILNLQNQKKTLLLDTIIVIFFLFSFILVLVLVFFSFDIIREFSLDIFINSKNFLFFYSLVVLILYIAFGIFLFNDRRDYYRKVSKNKFLNSMYRYRHYYLVDYIINGKRLQASQILYDEYESITSDKNESDTLSFKSFTSLFIPLLFGAYVSLVYKKIHTTDIVWNKSVGSEVVKGSQ